MVNGIDIFREYFRDFPHSFVVIGGTACDMLIEQAGLFPRATKDIDLILIVEALSREFVERFWTFISAGQYQQRQRGMKMEYYRFLHPQSAGFPAMIEIFSRQPDTVTLENPGALTPIPTSDDLDSLSAILMDEDYYLFTKQQIQIEAGIPIASVPSLICLKAKAYLDLSKRKALGEQIDSRNIKKHQLDVFRLCTLLVPEQRIVLPQALYIDLQAFANSTATQLPDSIIYKNMGLPGINSQILFDQLKACFYL